MPVADSVTMRLKFQSADDADATAFQLVHAYQILANMAGYFTANPRGLDAF
jgi:hypothetical protein